MDPQTIGGGGGFQTPPVVDQAREPGRRRSPAGVAAAVLALAVAFAAFGYAYSISGGGASLGAGAKAATGASSADVMARSAWRTAPEDKILPPTIHREGTETYYRLSVSSDETCAKLPAPFIRALKPAGCAHLLQATYADSTETVAATIGVVVVGGTANQRAALFQNWTADAYARQYTMMPSTYPVPATPASGFGDAQRVYWKSTISNDGTYISFAVTGFTDGRKGPGPSAFAAGNESELQSLSPPVQAADDLTSVLMANLGALYPGVNGAAG